MLMVACTSLRGPLPAPTSRPASGRLLAGAAETDITPPPGYPMAGHSREGRIGLGVWTRLRAKAVYLEDPDGQPLALVAVDLWGIPAGLADAVASRLARSSSTAHIGREHLVLAATHTHHGPGNFATAKVYNDLASPERGFDPELFTFVSDRIFAAIARAASKRRPARIVRHAVAVPTVARNRSLEPFMENPEAGEILRENATLPGCGPMPPELGGFEHVDPCLAVDPVLDTLHVTEAQGDDTIALLGFFAVHATAMPNRTELYHGDLFSIATTRARDALGGDAVVALFNGAEGDVSPNWARQGRAATTVLGDALAEAMLGSLAEEGRPVRGPFEAYYAVAPLADTVFADSTGARRRTGRRAIPGYGLAGGAEDGRTRWYARGHREGVVARRVRARGHGLKRPVTPIPLLGLAEPRGHFPLDVPLGVIRLSGLTLATLPGELTTVMGRRVARAVEAATGGSTRVVTVGLAGAYLSYFATPQEYALQHYEGASTLYGTEAGSLIAHHLAGIAHTRTMHRPATYRYRPGKARHFAPDRPSVRRRTDGAAERALTQLDALPRQAAVEVKVRDVMPQWPPKHADDPTTPRIRVQVELAGSWSPLISGTRHASDDGDGFLSVLEDIEDGKLSWALLWLDPSGTDPAASLRLVVDRVDGSTVCSASFSLAEHWRDDTHRPLETVLCE